MSTLDSFLKVQLRGPSIYFLQFHRRGPLQVYSQGSFLMGQAHVPYFVPTSYRPPSGALKLSVGPYLGLTVVLKSTLVALYQGGFMKDQLRGHPTSIKSSSKSGKSYSGFLLPLCATLGLHEY